MTLTGEKTRSVALIVAPVLDFSAISGLRTGLAVQVLVRPGTERDTRTDVCEARLLALTLFNWG